MIEPPAQAAHREQELRPQRTEIRVRGKTIAVPSVCIQGRRVIVKGKWIKLATLEDEDCLEGNIVENPDMFLDELKRGPLRADLFSFGQKPTQPKPQYGYHLEWDNAAVIPIADYASWWEKLPQETRRNVRKATKQGVEVRVTPFTDELVRGIVDIYNETPVRQGRKFWHYGKSFDMVKKEAGTYLERSEFIGAYFQGSLIGFAKLLYVDKCGTIMFILSQEQHADKRPTNALIAKCVEVCAERGCTSFQYRKYVYGANEANSLTEFKRRNGFEHVRFPRYYIPLSAVGAVVLKLGLHHGLVHYLPRHVSTLLRALRKWALEVPRKKSPTPAKAG